MTPEEIAKLPYRRNVGVMLINRDRHVWVGQRLDRRVDQAAWQMPQGGIDRGEDAIKACSMAKCFAGDAAVKCTQDAVQVFGGSGYIRGFEVERLYRDAKITQIYEGTNQIQRMIIARELMKNGATA